MPHKLIEVNDRNTNINIIMKIHEYFHDKNYIIFW